MAPIRVVQEINGSEDYRRARGACVFCDILKEEAGCKKRVVGETESFLAIAPCAARSGTEHSCRSCAWPVARSC